MLMIYCRDDMHHRVVLNHDDDDNDVMFTCWYARACGYLYL